MMKKAGTNGQNCILYQILDIFIFVWISYNHYCIHIIPPPHLRNDLKLSRDVWIELYNGFLGIVIE